ncbi:hypothetical protein PYCC9005_003151 [Savitreella phatthalungensis]
MDAPMQLPWYSAGPLPPRTKRRTKRRAVEPSVQDAEIQTTEQNDQARILAGSEITAEQVVTKAPVIKTAPKSWSELLKSATAKNGEASRNGGRHQLNASGIQGYSFTNLPDLLDGYDPFTHATSPLIEPRGLVNKGNMCFMNAVLQLLVYCPPFYNLFDRIGREVRQKMDSKTPLMDAMIMFIREFRLLKTLAASTGKTGERAMQAALELIGETFGPDNIYSSMSGNPRFKVMQRGHQEDAEEFLGFLLDGLHEEFIQAMREGGNTLRTVNNLQAPSESLSATNSDAGTSTAADEWLEVGKKSKTSVTRTAAVMQSPMTRIFGGNVRSILKIGGSRDSVTLEPYQPLQLDIQAPEIRSIVDALRALPEPEVLSDDWVNGKGLKVQATKQVFIETLPPVLILHLKRFLYDNVGGTQKSWKQVGYPLELEIPNEAISPSRRGRLNTKYRLLGVVYHHGLSASGGHYTVDVLRQDGKSWIHLDDTTIEPVDERDVAVAEVDEERRPFVPRPNKLAYILMYGQSA